MNQEFAKLVMFHSMHGFRSNSKIEHSILTMQNSNLRAIGKNATYNTASNIRFAIRKVGKWTRI